jgi:hypothetical protein
MFLKARSNIPKKTIIGHFANPNILEMSERLL